MRQRKKQTNGKEKIQEREEDRPKQSMKKRKERVREVQKQMRKKGKRKFWTVISKGTKFNSEIKINREQCLHRNVNRKRV